MLVFGFVIQNLLRQYLNSERQIQTFKLKKLEIASHVGAIGAS